MRGVVIFSVTSVASTSQPTYVEWCEQYGKNGDAQRGAFYAATVKNIEQLNAEGGAVFAVNEYSDLTLDEWRKARGIVGFSQPAADGQPGQCNFEQPDARVLSDDEIKQHANDEVDWVTSGAVTPVKDQGSSGTCGYFASAAVVEGIHVVQGKNALVSISEQEVIDCCTPGNGGCNGWPGQEIDWYNQRGIFAKTEESYRYKGSSQIPKPDGSTCYSASGVATTVTTSGRVCLGLSDPDAITAHLALMGPAVWMIDATCLQSYSRGVISQVSCSGSGGVWPHYNGIDHATTLVGSGTDNGVEYWKVRNSWGKSWGEAGYYRVKKDAAGATKPNLHAIGAIFGKYSISSVSV